MALVQPIVRAKQYLILPSTAQTDNALIPATQEFQQKYKRYLKLSNMPEAFDSVSVEEIDDDYVWVELDPAIIKKMYLYFQMSVAAGNYAGYYQVLQIDTSSNKVMIEADYFNETITFDNAELQLYYDALGWYICGHCTFTLQELKERNVLVTSSQAGDCDITQYSQGSIGGFRKQMFANGDRLLRQKHFPRVF